MTFLKNANALLQGFAGFALAVLAPSSGVAAGTAFALSTAAQPVFESSLAKVVSPQKVDISAGMDGVLLHIYTLEAAKVSAGDPLFLFDCRSKDLALKRAKLALKISEGNAEQAKAALYRSTEGLRSNSVSKAQNDADTLAFETATLDVADKALTRDGAMLAVENCSVTAPFAGVITKIAVGPGGYLVAGTLVLSMTGTENLEVIAQLTPAEIDILGRSKFLDFVAGDEKFPLTIRAVEPVFDNTTGAQRVLLQLPGNADLPIGLTGMLRWNGGRFSLPSEFLVRRAAEVGLLIEKNGTQTFYPVPGAIEGLPALVALPADTKVILP